MMGEKGKYTERFLCEERGAVAIEAGLYFVVFFLLCALLLDFSAVFLNKSYLERVTNSLASVVRERTAFYDEREELSQDDVDDLYKLASVLLEGSRLADSHYQLVVEAVFFETSPSNAEKTVASTSTQSFSQGTATCNVPVSITSTQITDLSPWHTDGRWLPVYQITVCVPGGESLFKRLLGTVGITIGDLAVSNAVIPR